MVKKKIQHKPSVYKSSEEIAHFKQAKERTTILYNKTFGEQPKEFWHYNSIYEALHLKKSNISTSVFLFMNAFVLPFAIMVLYTPLKSIYTKINNPSFIFLFILIIVGVFFMLHWYNKTKLSSLLNRWEKNIFVFKLTPMELIYLNKKNIGSVCHGILNEMIKDKKISITKTEKLIIEKEPENVFENAVYSTLIDNNKTEYYVKILGQIMDKPALKGIVKSRNAFQEYFITSKEYFKLFTFNLYIFSFLFILGFTRLFTGISREKPILFLFSLLIVFIGYSISYLLKLKNYFLHQTIPEYYSNKVTQLKKEEQKPWEYFMHEKAALVSSFIPLVDYANTMNSNSSQSTCGSSCGSSCSSCGGCGGCGD